MFEAPPRQLGRASARRRRGVFTAIVAAALAVNAGYAVRASTSLGGPALGAAATGAVETPFVAPSSTLTKSPAIRQAPSGRGPWDKLHAASARLQPRGPIASWASSAAPAPLTGRPAIPVSSPRSPRGPPRA